MKQRLERVAGHDYARSIGLGMLAGLILLAVALIWRGSRSDTVVLNVAPITDTNMIRVYVGGEVALPGIYSLPRGSRVAEAIDAAGGATERSDVSGFGMAAPLQDADQIIVPARAAAAPPSDGRAATESSPVLAGGGLAPLNINQATEEQLIDLPGIGPALAERIIEHRQRIGFFRSVDELADVQGISPRMVDELRSLITTGP